MSSVLSVFAVSPSKIGSQEAFAREVSLQLDRHGWRSILCFEAPAPEPVRRYLALPNVSLEVADGLEYTSWPAVRSLSRLLRRYRPDILHLYYTGFLGLYPWLARLRAVDRVFFTDQTSRPESYTPRRAAWWKRGLARLLNWPLSRVICVSGYGYQCLTALDLLPADRFQVIYSAVDVTRGSSDPERAVECRRRFGIPADRSVVSQVSWMIPEKGIGDLLEAARLVIAQKQDVQFLLVGDGAHREQFARAAVEMGIGDHVTWTGLVQDPLGDGVYAVADVVCQVSRWGEVFGYVIAEAMACGKPVVATRVGGIPELVVDDETGFLVPRGDVAQIAARILRLLSDDALRTRLGSAGREAAAAKFNLPRNVGQLLSVYGLS